MTSVKLLFICKCYTLAVTCEEYCFLLVIGTWSIQSICVLVYCTYISQLVSHWHFYDVCAIYDE